MEIVSAIVGPVIQTLMVPVKQYLSYLISSTKYVTNMSTSMKQLNGISDEVKNHMVTNDRNNLEVPDRVKDWLEDVEKIKKEVESISGNGNGCYNMKMRYRVGRQASKITQDIERLVKENPEINWIDRKMPLGKVNRKRASDGDTKNDFKSRDRIFKDALEFLQLDYKTQVIALCGMGGVGKTTMMEQLKQAVEKNNMFDWIVKVVIGQQTNSFSIQQAVAEYIRQPLTESIKTTRADLLHVAFREMSERKQRILVILDDVWEMVELKDIGLSPLPNGCKLLLTSRKKDICKRIAVEAGSDLEEVKVDVLEEVEAHNFFCQITGFSKEDDPELNKIGSDIVRKCGRLPLAIKLIATTLKSEKKSVWRDTLRRLKKNDLDTNVQKIIEISYDHLKKEDDKAIFLLCGLFPDDFNIPIEELTRYAWGLKLLNEVRTLGEARDQTETCVSHLKNANLLMDCDYHGCVKVHDLVLAFVQRSVSKGDHASIIYHGDMSKWSGVEMSQSCKRISLTCMGMSEFPRDFKYPNLSLLKLMHGDWSLRFPEDFYGNMKKLEVIAYENMPNPLLHRSFQCLTNLRTLCLQNCWLIDDLSLVGNLVNLEVLSFAHCHIRKLPSAIQNLEKLRLLDLTGCVGLRIDDGVLKSLEKLEELYMRSADEKTINFTDENCIELVERSKNLSALEIEFFKNNAQPKNMSLKQLERFKISMGRFLEKETKKSLHSFENTLMLIATTGELLESRMSELFEETKVLYLEVDDVNDLKDVLVEPLSPPRNPFYNLRVLHVNKCVHLSYLFTIHVARGLTKLERLIVSGCLVMRELICSENSEVEAIIFQKLKFLVLEGLPKLVSLCNTTIELPQLVELRLDGLPNFTSIYPENKSTTSSMSSNIFAVEPLLNKKVVIPKLEILNIKRMENLKEIWPCQITSSEEVNISMLREIKVKQCDSLVNLFPNNPMSLLHCLEKLQVQKCGSLEVLFNIDLGCVGEIGEGSSRLRHIRVYDLGKLREVWRIKCVKNYDLLVRGFQDVEEIQIDHCESFRYVFTPTTINFDMGAVTFIGIDTGKRGSGRNNELVGSSQEEEEISEVDEEISEVSEVDEEISEVDDNIPNVINQKINVISNKQEISEEVDDIIPNVAFPSHLMHTFHHLQKVRIHNCIKVEVVFDMESASSRELATTRNNQQPLLLLPHLKDLYLLYMRRMSHVWKCNWNKFLIPQKQPPESSFHNLTIIRMSYCHNIKYLFSPLMAKLLSNLKEVHIEKCNGIEEVVSNRDDENEEMTTSTSTHTSTALFPHLDILFLNGLPNLKRIGGDKGGSNEISLNNTTTTTSTYDPIKCSGVACWSLCQYSRKIHIVGCHTLSSVIPSHVVGQPQKLEELDISLCNSMMEVFESKRVDNGDGSVDTGNTLPLLESPRLANMTVHNFPYLKSLCISGCDLLEHIFIFSTLESLKQLKELTIQNCKAMKVVVKEDEEHTTTSKVVIFHRLMSLGLDNLPNLEGFFLGMNEFEWSLLDKVEIYGCPQMIKFTSGQSKCSQGGDFSWSLCPYSKKIRISRCEGLSSVFPSHAVGQLEKLEELEISFCKSMMEVFEIEGVNNDGGPNTNVDNGSGDSTSTMGIFPRLTNMTLLRLSNLKILQIKECDLLQHVFTFSTLESLKQLKKLRIEDCKAMKVIVKEEKEEHTTTSKDVVFPRLQSLELVNLPNLESFFSGKNDFQWPLLDMVKIKGCPQMMVFTSGHSTASGLKYIHTSLGKYSLDCGLTFQEAATLHQVPFSSLDSTSLCPTSEEIPWRFSNLIEIDMLLWISNVKKIIPSNELLKLQKLEKIQVIECYDIVEVFEALNETYSGFNESQSVVKLPNLKEVILYRLQSLKCIWKSNQWTTLEFPNLTRVFIQGCTRLEHVFTCSMAGSLSQLQELHITECKSMEVIVKEANVVLKVQEVDAIMNKITLHCLKSLQLEDLPSFKGFCLGNEAFSFPSLNTLEIKKCPEITVFTNGHSDTPKLHPICTYGMRYDDLNSWIKTKQQELSIGPPEVSACSVM